MLNDILDFVFNHELDIDEAHTAWKEMMETHEAVFLAEIEKIMRN